MAIKKFGRVEKTEMTSMIDVIFLLLIFFLVTLNISQGGGGASLKKIDVTVPLKGEGEIEADFVVYIDKLGDDANYYIIRSSFKGNHINAITAKSRSFYGQKNVIQRIMNSFPPRGQNFVKDVADLKPLLSNANSVLIWGNKWLSFGDIMEVVDACDSPSRAKWFVRDFTEIDGNAIKQVRGSEVIVRE